MELKERRRVFLLLIRGDSKPKLRVLRSSSSVEWGSRSKSANSGLKSPAFRCAQCTRFKRKKKERRFFLLFCISMFFFVLFFTAKIKYVSPNAQFRPKRSARRWDYMPEFQNVPLPNLKLIGDFRKLFNKEIRANGAREYIEISGFC